MPEENRFFRAVSRFNTLALAAAAIGIIALIVVAGIAALQFEHNWIPDANLQPAAKQEKQKFTYKLSSAEQGSLRGQKLFVLQRWKGDRKTRGYSDSLSGDYAQDVNLLIVDAATGTGRWVFRGNERTIVSRDAILESEPNKEVEAPPAIGMAIVVIDVDTNGDGDLNAKDQQTLYGYRLDGESVKKLITADDFLGAQQFGADRYMVAYAEKEKARLAMFTLPEFKLLSDTVLPNVPK